MNYGTFLIKHSKLIGRCITTEEHMRKVILLSMEEERKEWSKLVLKRDKMLERLKKVAGIKSQELKVIEKELLKKLRKVDKKRK